MIKVIGVRFRQAGKIYYFSPGKLKINRGDHVIVETARGVEYGYVVVGNRDVEDDRVVQPLKPVIRRSPAQSRRHRHPEVQSPARLHLCTYAQVPLPGQRCLASLHQ